MEPNRGFGYDAGWFDGYCYGSPGRKCLCEKDATIEKAFTSWCAEREPLWLAPYRKRAFWTFFSGLLIGLSRAIGGLVLSYVSKPPVEWSAPKIFLNRS